MFFLIFYLNCEYVLFVYILKQKQKSSRILWNKIVDFENLLEIKFCSQISLKKSARIFKIYL